MGRFAQVSDVTSRFEGTFPSDREAWVDTRIDDVEGILMGLVPSLTASDITADRLQRVKTLVCEKVLHLYRNPDGATQWTNTVDDVTESRSYGRSSTSSAGASVVFSSSELRSVRLPRVKSRVGMIPVAPWVPHAFRH
jgi:hypothetical protein